MQVFMSVLWLSLLGLLLDRETTVRFLAWLGLFERSWRSISWLGFYLGASFGSWRWLDSVIPPVAILFVPTYVCMHLTLRELSRMETIDL